jgi:thiol-disulfide isomerase/thioredoxin/outer membrane protein assembly factor BamD (BamD/ComL family)
VWVPAGVAILVLCGTAFGAAKPEGGMVGKPAPEIQAAYWLNTEALSLKGLRGKIVVVEFWATWCPPCRASIPHLIEMNHKVAGKGVVFISLTDEDRKTVEPFAREMKMDYAVGGGSQTSGVYGVTGIPHAFIVDPSGTVAWEGHPMAGLDRALESQLEKTPPSRMAPRDQAVALALMDLVAKAIEKQDFVSAADLMAKIPNADDDPAVKKRADEARRILAEVAAKDLAEAEARIEAKEYYEASAALERVLRLVPGSDEARRAEAKRTELMADEKIRPVVEQGRRERRAADMLAAIEKSEKDMTLERLLKELGDLADAFPDTKAGKGAAARIAEMKADKELMARIRLQAAEKDCKSWLSMARNYVKAGMPDKARPYLKDILAKYPDTPFAEEARNLLAEIGK